jgi:hypothetical protein
MSDVAVSERESAMSQESLEAVSKPLPEKGTVPFFSQGAEKLGQSPTDLKPLLVEPAPPASDPRQIESVLEHVRQALAGLRFGTVSLVVQDGVVVQVERTERKRFRRER